MIGKIRYPAINGATDREQIDQIRRYLFQLADQLNFTLAAMDTESKTYTLTDEDIDKITKKVIDELAKKT